MVSASIALVALVAALGLEHGHAQSLSPFQTTFAFTSCITVEPKAGPINTTAGQVFDLFFKADTSYSVCADFNVVNGTVSGAFTGTVTGGTEELTERSDGTVLSKAHVYGQTDDSMEPFSINLISRGNTTVMFGQASGILNGNSGTEYFTCKSGPKDGVTQGLVGVTDCYVLQ